MMTQDEKEALLGYLEFHLVKLCESVQPNLDPDAVGDMYNNAYAILNDVEYSIQSHLDNMGGNSHHVDSKAKK